MLRDIFVFMLDTLLTIKMLFMLILFATTVTFLIIPVILLFLKWRFACSKKKSLATSTTTKVGLFHPYCNAGGGGEKVLWVALQSMKEKYPDAEYYIYTGDAEATPTEIIAKVNKNLNVKLDMKQIHFVYLTRRVWVEAQMYPYFTLLGQSLGSIYLGYEALCQLHPDIFIDTTGFAFTLPLFKYLAGCKTGCYVHYPTITTDMLKRVANRRAMYNNRNIIARSPFLTTGKLFYYRIFAWLYSFAGQCSDITTVNSTFTMEHLTDLWNRPLHLVYPPCDVDHLVVMERDAPKTNIRILSLSQFRPEKDHAMQLQALYELREIIPDALFERITLVLAGSCRNTDDADRVRDLRDLSKHLSLENSVEFQINVPYDRLLDEFRSAHIGIHTMVDEHFGISVVELMAAGLITVAHRSGGPLLDIIETSEASRLGFLASTAEEYAHTLKFILYLSDEELDEIRTRARASVDRFSTKKFKDDFLRAVEPLFKSIS